MLAAAVLAPGQLRAQTSGKVYIFGLKDEIGPSSWRLTRNAFSQAEAQGAKVIIVDLNTFGGMVDYADSIRTAILSSKLKSIVFIDNNAASAGTLISYACNEIYMKRGASMGAASVVNPKGELMPEKYQSYMRGLMRATAEARGRDPRIAEAFVDPDVVVPGLIEKGKVLTLTSSEAVKAGVSKAEVNSLNEVLGAEGLAGWELVYHQTTLVDRIISFLINPLVSGLLILLIIGGIYFEMQSPGIGFALLVSVIAALLFFAPLYLEGLAANWEIALFIAGVILLALEIFVIPGFGIAGILGIIFILSGLALSLVLNDWFDFTVTGSEQLSKAVGVVLIAMVAAIVLAVVFGRSLLNAPVFQRLVLHHAQDADKGFVAGRQSEDLLGSEGVCQTDLRPSGKIEINGKWYDAVAMDGFVSKGSLVYVVKQENYNVFVRKIIS